MLYRSQDLYCNILWSEHNYYLYSNQSIYVLICTASLALTVNFKDEGNVLSNQDAEKIWKMHVYSVKISCVNNNLAPCK